MSDTRTSAFLASLDDVEWRTSGNAHDYTFTGRAVVFNSWSEELWTSMGVFRERIMPGAFTDVLAAGPDVRLLYNHDESKVLARTRSGTLELEETDNGLHVWARVAPTSYAKDLRMVMARGDVDQMSFMFAMDEEHGAEERWYEDDATGGILRDIIRVSGLLDVSPVTFPAYADTTASMRERELRSAVDAGRIVLPHNAAQDDPAGDQSPPGGDADAVDVSTPAPDPAVDGSALDQLKQRSKTALHSAGERHLQLKKEIARP
jgi:hypothetical protein